MLRKSNHINTYILAGGKSTRMGTDKGLLLFHGKPLIERIIEELNPVFEKTAIVSNNPEYERFGLEVVKDLIKDIGPAGGIHAALNHTQAKKVFIVSCDMPFVARGAVEYILENSGEAQIVVPSFRGNIQPLFGVYAADCLPQWNRLLELGIVKLRQMISHFKLLRIDVNENKLFNEILFMNVNDPNDFTKAVKQL